MGAVEPPPHVYVPLIGGTDIKRGEEAPGGVRGSAARAEGLFFFSSSTKRKRPIYDTQTGHLARLNDPFIHRKWVVYVF